VPLACACSEQRASLSLVQVRDSAGISIVETSQPAWGTERGWTVDAAPFISIGETDGDDPYLFDRIRGTFRRRDGSIVVADGGTRELREFDSTGRFVGAKGQRGPGPGEFGSISTACASWYSSPRAARAGTSWTFRFGHTSTSRKAQHYTESSIHSVAPHTWLRTARTW
jgi:hypothetical protein